MYGKVHALGQFPPPPPKLEQFKLYLHIPTGQVVMCVDAEKHDGLRMTGPDTEQSAGLRGRRWCFSKMDNYKLWDGTLALSN